MPNANPSGIYVNIHENYLTKNCYRLDIIAFVIINFIYGHAQILTKNDTISREAKNFGVLINIPEYLLYDGRGKLRNQFLGTFFDRVILFKFKTDWKEWKRALM